MMKQTLSTVQAVAKLNNNQIPANLLAELGYKPTVETKKALSNMNITISEDINVDPADAHASKLSAQEILYYVLRYQNNDTDALTLIATAYDRYLQLEAYRICRNHLTHVEDIRSCGLEGLIVAAKNFSISSSVYFAGYAKRVIQNHMNDGNMELIMNVHMNDSIKAMVMKLYAYAEDNELLTRNWTDEDIEKASERFGISIKLVNKYRQYFKFFNTYYIDGTDEFVLNGNTAADNGKTMKTTRKDNDINEESEVVIESAETVYMSSIGEEWVAEMLSDLEPEERSIFEDYAGLNEEGKILSIKANSEKHGLSRYETEQKILAVRKKLFKKLA